MANLCASCLSNCQSCDNCNGACQGSKQKISNKNGKFYFREKKKELSKDDLFLTANEWNNLIEYIKDGYDLAKEINNSINSDSVYKYKEKETRAGKKYKNEFMTANMWNGAYAKMRWLSTGNGSLEDDVEKKGGSNGDIIRAQYFNDLQDYYNNDFKAKYCDKCLNCQGCNSQTDTYCCSCNEGETSTSE